MASLSASRTARALLSRSRIAVPAALAALNSLRVERLVLAVRLGR